MSEMFKARSSTDRKYNLRWAYSSMGMPEADLLTLMSLAREWGIEELELRTLENSIDLPGVLSQRFGNPQKFTSFLSSNDDVRVSVLSGSLRLAENTPEDRSAFLDYVPWAEAGSVRWLRAFDFVGPYADWTDAMFETAVDTLRWWHVEKARNDWSVDMLVEGHHRMFYPEMYERICDALGWAPALLFDLGHALRELGNEGALAAYERLSDYVPRVHLKDPAVVIPNGMKHTIPGEGTGNLEAFMACFEQVSPCPVVTLEWERQWEKRLPELPVAFQSLRDHSWL